MGKGEGHGEGHGEGQGHGQGEGRGESDSTGVIAGASLAVACTVIFCIFGIPMLIAGSVLIVIGISDLYTVGIALVSVAGILSVIAIVLIILLCTGKLTKKSNVTPATTVVSTTTYNNGQMAYTNQPTQGYVQQPPAYSGNRNPPAYSQAQQYPSNQGQPQGAPPGGVYPPPQGVAPVDAAYPPPPASRY